MRAIRISAFGGPEKLRLETNVPVPSVGRDEVLIRVDAAGVNPADTYMREGTFADLPNLPFTPGFDAAGIVEAVGAEVKGFKKGDRVYTVETVSGSYAEYTTAKAHYVGHLNDKLSFAQGAAVGVPYYTAVEALHLRARARPGETVLIHGASGAVGIAAIQVSKALGLRVLGTAGTQEGLDLVKKTGADMVFNHREDGYAKAIKQAVGEVSIILEMLANVNLPTDIDLISLRGRIMLIGCKGPLVFDPRFAMRKECAIMGILLLSSTVAEFQEMHSLLAAGQQCGWVVPQVAREYPLGKAGDAQRDVISNQGTAGKLVINVYK